MNGLVQVLEAPLFREILAFVLALVLALYTTPLMRQAAIRFGIVDRPDGRLKTQREPVPYLGGLAIYLSFLLALTATLRFDSTEVLGLLLAGAIVLILGLVDDFGVLTPKIKLAGQVVAVATLMNASIYIKLSFLPPFVAIGLSFLWLLAITNAFNIIDVMDGLAAGVAAAAAAVLFLIAVANGRTTYAVCLAALCGALCGFLRFNLPPARIYMGDAGSLFVGLLLGALSMNNSYTRRNLVASLAPIVILGDVHPPPARAAGDARQPRPFRPAPAPLASEHASDGSRLVERDGGPGARRHRHDGGHGAGRLVPSRGARPGLSRHGDLPSPHRHGTVRTR
jgi:UDP-GlcNAc:undecaprenyl-phosphate GlcNAc-1-phosphate transferase